MRFRGSGNPRQDIESQALKRLVLERQYLRGRRWTVWLWSLLYGGFMFFWMTVCDFIFLKPALKIGQDWVWLVLSLVFWLAAGYGLGAYQWRRIEAKTRAIDQD